MYRRGDLGQVARVLGALRGFKHGRSTRELAAEVGASDRTVRRDITELQDAGFDIEVSKRDNRSIARLVEDRNYSPVPITKRERFTLLGVRSAFDVLRGTPFLDDVNSVLAKLEQRMSPKDREEHASFGERFVYQPDHGTKSYAGMEDVIDAIQTGILSRKVVRYRYSSSGGRAKAGFVAPYAMVLYRQGLYVLGGRLSSAADEARSSKLGVFAVERFAEAEHLKHHPFDMPPDFRIHDELRRSFNMHLGEPGVTHEVVVEFSREKALLVSSREWHATQRIEKLADGRVRVAFDCPDVASVVSWILEWGPHARVTAPPELVELVRGELDGARAQY